jgi:hypothetical protein
MGETLSRTAALRARYEVSADVPQRFDRDDDDHHHGW